MRTPRLLLTVAMVLGACSAQDELPGRGLAISVAPLTLPGVGKVCYDLKVTDGPTKTDPVIWQRGSLALNGASVGGDPDTLCSSNFGNGTGGDITFVGACVASPVDAGQTGRTNSVTLWVDSLYDSSNTYISPTGSDGWQNPCPDGCTLTALCRENADTLVEFNLTILRQANQGFFDIGVNFEDIFCSAKVDCVTGANEPLKLLFRPGTSTRDTTVVSAFACTAGAGASVETVLYRNPLTITCGASPPIVLDPDVGKGNAWTTDPTPGDAIWQYAVYSGDESLMCGGVSCNKRYWNVAFGLEANTANCVLSTTMTASAGELTDFSTPENTTYPYISVNVPLTGSAGLTCTKHPVNGGNGVATLYTELDEPLDLGGGFNGMSFAEAPGACATSGKVVFNATGSVQSFIAPDGCDLVEVKMWGAGGGGFCWSGNGSCQTGGGGGFTSGVLSVTSGETLSVIVGGAGFGGVEGGYRAGGFGGGGNSGSAGYGGSGGGRSAIRRGSVELATAGGGGGAGASNGGVGGNSYGGAGGGLSGQNGGNPSNGLGGSQTAGGTGAGGNGSAFQGGTPSGGDNGGGGAGGGGYFGGGAGSSANNGEGGGGGGSGYVGGLTNAVTVGGAQRIPAMITDKSYVSGVGEGGLGSSGTGGNGKAGLVEISWGPPTALAYAKSSFVANNNLPMSIPAPSFNGVSLTNCTITPALPSGLSLDSLSCAISGTTALLLPETQFTVTATNPYGFTSATFTLRVTDECIAGSQEFAYTGSNQSFVVPAGCTQVSVKLWGAGGGGYCYSTCAAGGGGGFTTGTLSVTASESLTILVGGAGLGGENGVFKAGGFGGGGNTGNQGYAGSGGGRSAIRRGSVELGTAGGGGGGGASYGGAAGCGVGGAGGGLTGANGGCAGNGLGGTQTAGGAANGGGGSGSAFQGGVGNNGDQGGGGGGGGGYYGGGSGSSANNGEGGGGGGSGFIGGLLTGAMTTAGSGTTPAGTGDIAYKNSAGTGGAAAVGAAGNGKHGRVVISWAP